MHSSRRRPVLEANAESGRRGAIAPFDLALHHGEVVGLAGLLGSGRTEVARLLFGADRADSGKFAFDGRPVTIRSPRAATANGVAFCPENRRTEGLIEDLTVQGEHRPRAAGLARLDAVDPAEAPGRARRRTGSGHWTSGPTNAEQPVRHAERRQPAEGPARALADHASRSCSSSTSRRGASTSARRRRFSASWSRCATTESRCSSSRPRSKRCSG